MTITNEMNFAINRFAQTYATTPAQITNGFFLNSEEIKKQAIQCLSFWEFGNGINKIIVNDRDGESLLGSVGDPTSGRTDILLQDRLTNPLLSLPVKYKTTKMNTDTSMTYARMQQWGANSQFNKLYLDFTQQRLGIDRLIVAWNGTSDETATTDPVLDPFLKKVAKGWVQVVREQFPLQVIDREILIGQKSASPETVFYSCIDEAVLDCINNIPQIFRDNLVCIIGDRILHDEQTRIYQNTVFHSEKQSTADTFKIFGGIPRIDCVGFPSNAIVVTSLDNLSMYFKGDTSYRQIVNVPKRERAEDYQTHEIAFVVENARKFVALTNLVTLEDSSAVKNTELNNELNEYFDARSVNKELDSIVESENKTKRMIEIENAKNKEIAKY